MTPQRAHRRSCPIASRPRAATTGCSTTRCRPRWRCARVAWPAMIGPKAIRTSRKPGPECARCPRSKRDELAPIEALGARGHGQQAPVGRRPRGRRATSTTTACRSSASTNASREPHTDSRALCRYAAVLYLNPDAPAHCGTSFYRQRLPNGQLGGNAVMPPHANLVEALGIALLSPRIRSSRTSPSSIASTGCCSTAPTSSTAPASYCGSTLADKRMAAVFFWMAA